MENTTNTTNNKFMARDYSKTKTAPNALITPLASAAMTKTART